MRMEVVERAGLEEDRVRERAVQRREARRLSAWVADRDVEESRLDRAQPRFAVQRDAISVGVDRTRKRRKRLRLRGTRHVDASEELEVRSSLRVRVDDDAVPAGARE